MPTRMEPFVKLPAQEAAEFGLLLKNYVKLR